MRGEPHASVISSPGKISRFALRRRLGWPQNWSGLLEKRYVRALRLPGFEVSAFGFDIVSLDLGPPTGSPSEILTTVFL